MQQIADVYDIIFGENVQGVSTMVPTGFIDDFVIIIKEKYNETLEGDQNESEEDKAFRNGLNFAYYDVLDILESQLKVFQFDTTTMKPITPMLGKKAST